MERAYVVVYKGMVHEEDRITGSRCYIGHDGTDAVVCIRVGTISKLDLSMNMNTEATYPISEQLSISL